MLYFYNPTTQQRINESILYRRYGATAETAAAKGWYPFSILPIAYDRTYYTIEEAGVVSGDMPHTYKLDWTLVPRDLDDIRKDIKTRLAAHRYQIETDGLVIGGSVVRTDRESQATVTGAKTFSDIDPAAVVNWKSAEGWTAIDRATIIALASAVGSHVQTCFSRERALAEAIDSAADIEALQAIDIYAGWPETASINTPVTV